MGGVTEDMLKDGSAMTDRTLSSAAQAVMDAFLSEWDVYAVSEARWATAAALRAAADQAIPMTKTPWGSTLVPVLTAQESRERILAIAAELEGGNG
jgi:hypothetical protein